jgi:hypothetical protein
MAELKTRKTDASVTAYLNAIADKQKRAGCNASLARLTGGSNDNTANPE